ncbi:hypothetical protein [Limosilactobacillus sp.]|uniref:hypothetical protein n=1 Tax=Limosilactobacillus sp. TaxID=2773925 RepID=UPI0025C438D2|nr:hypothetical protein [Limosilactobacillus sp.]MCH3922300.1 hypothetical protein [Limosilactobacillus sp.]MCH3929072.1 hypothetical protein [Limosilactobacillus sp.]
MESIFLFGLTIAFLVESFYETRLYMLFQVIVQRFPQFTQNKRLTRIMRVEQTWNWLSWVLLIALILLPNHYTILLISVITLIETIIVFEMDRIRSQLNQPK